MSEPIHLLNIPIVGTTSGISGDMTTSINSLPINLDFYGVVSYSIRAQFTGTPVGILQLQCSDDNTTTGTPPDSSYTVITDSVQGITTAGSYTVNVEFPAYSWVRLQYISTSSTGTMTARINAKRR